MGDTVGKVSLPQQATLKWQTREQMAVKASHTMKIFFPFESFECLVQRFRGCTGFACN